MADPFTDAIDALWTRLEANSEFTALVKPNCRIKMSDDTDPQGKQMQDNDAPQVAIGPATCDTDLHVTSSSASITLNYDVAISTYDMRLKRGIFPVFWQVLKTVSDFPDTTITSGKIIDVRVIAVSFGDQDEKTGTTGWAAILTLAVEMTFDRTELEPA